MRSLVIDGSTSPAAVVIVLDRVPFRSSYGGFSTFGSQAGSYTTRRGITPAGTDATVKVRPRLFPPPVAQPGSRRALTRQQYVSSMSLD